MIDTILTYAETTGATIDAATQASLCDALVHQHDLSGLARLCHLDGLDAAVDARLGTMESAPVRAAWLLRPGRSQRDIAKKLRTERRVSVIADVMSGALPDGLHAQLLHRVDSAAVTVAALSSPTAPAPVRREASQTLAATYHNLTLNQRTEVGDLWAADAGLAVAALEVVQDLSIVPLMVGAVRELSGAARQNLIDVVTARGAESAENVRAATRREFPAGQQVRATAEVLSTLIGYDWCPDEVVETAQQFLTIAMDPASTRAVGSYYAAGRRLQSLVEARRDGSASSIRRLVDSALTCNDEELAAVMESTKELGVEWSSAVLRNLLINEHLSVRALLSVEASAGYELHVASADVPDGAISVNARAMLALCHAIMPDPDTADLVIAHLGIIRRDSAHPVVHNLFTLDLSDAQVWSVPAAPLAGLISVDDDVASRVGQLLLDELRGSPLGSWLQLAEYSAGFPGTLGELIETCRASHA